MKSKLKANTLIWVKKQYGNHVPIFDPKKITRVTSQFFKTIH